MLRLLNHLESKVRFWRAGTSLEKRYHPLPCSMCGFAVPVVAKKGQYGSQCLYFDVYIPRDDLFDSQGAMRRACIRSGNQFRFRMKDMSPMDMLQWRMKHTDWYLKRTSVRIGAIVGVVSLVMTALGIWLKP
ncbi:MAG: hypothetical protein ACYC9J_11655 [Sulfuricaulis sp.]